MTRSAVNPPTRPLLARAMTLAALFRSVAFASAASAASADDGDDRGSSASVQSDDEVAPQLRTALADHLTNKGATVVHDSRGRLVIAPYLCNAKKPEFLQPDCVTSPPTPGGGRF